MAIIQGGGVALWRQIAETLQDDIARKSFSKTGRLPTETDLAVRFGVNRHTVRRAVAALQEQGLVRVEQGRGTFLQEGIIDYRLGKRTRFSENMRQLQMTPSGELLRALSEPADTSVAKALGLRAGSPVIRIDNRRKADGQIVSMAAHYFPERRFPGLIEVYKEERSVTAALRHFGVLDYTRKTTRVTARLPDAFEAKHLQISRTQPVLVAEFINVEPDGKPLEFGIGRFAADRIQLVIDT